MRRSGIHLGAFLAILLCVPAPSLADDDMPKAGPHPKEAQAPAPIPAVRIPIEGKVTSVQAGPGGRDLLIGTDAGVTIVWTAGKGFGDSVPGAMSAVTATALSPNGRLVAVATEKHLSVRHMTIGTQTVKIPRPVAFGFRADDSGLVTGGRLPRLSCQGPR
mgnify:CR=1 FL=1